jgi:AcrR family transcriptional regulator
MAKARPGSSGRLSVDDWIQAGYAILAEEGIKALKIDRLCKRLGVTKGSFYWHFTDMAGYRAALVDSWGALRDQDRRHFSELTTSPPRERLSQMMSSLLGTRHWTLERAMREWARTDTAIAARLRAADQRVLETVRQAFVDSGFDEDDAAVRADATFAAGIGFLHLSGQTPNSRAAAWRERFLDIMLKG